MSLFIVGCNASDNNLIKLGFDKNKLLSFGYDASNKILVHAFQQEFKNIKLGLFYRKDRKQALFFEGSLTINGDSFTLKLDGTSDLDETEIKLLGCINTRITINDKKIQKKSFIIKKGKSSIVINGKIINYHENYEL